MRPGQESPQGAAYRSKLESMLLEAGEEGAKAPDLRANLRIGLRMMRKYLRESEWAYCARTDFCPWIRWFHVKHEAVADDYKAKCNAVKTNRTVGYFSSASRQAILAALNEAGEMGLSMDQIAERTGLARRTVQSGIPKMRRDHGVVDGPDVEQPKPGPLRRYYSPGIQARQWPKIEKPKRVRVRSKTDGAKKVRKPRHIPKPLPHQKMTGLAAKNHKAIKPPSGPVIIPPGLVPEVGPAFRDTRFIPDRVDPFFSAMTHGSYIRTGSAIERAYAQRESGAGAANAAG